MTFTDADIFISALMVLFMLIFLGFALRDRPEFGFLAGIAGFLLSFQTYNMVGSLPLALLIVAFGIMVMAYSMGQVYDKRD